jgi:uncharacterized protein YhfF
MRPIDAQSAASMWAAYLERHPEHAGDQPPTERFGDSEELADELLGLVLNGPKRATAGAVAEFEHDGQPLPRIGGHWIVADGSGVARAILRSTELRIGPLDSVDDAFAWDEGEGDRSRAYWLAEHRRYFRRSLARIGIESSDQLEVVFERFEVVWPTAG